MNDLTRYRIHPHSLAEIEKARRDWRVAKVRPYDVVPDTTLQDIADAVKAYKEFDYEPYINSDSDEPLENDPAHVLNALLDALERGRQ